jgi:hypothetical protein
MWGICMQIKCLAGYFQFREQRIGEMAKFASMFSMSIVAINDYYTFSFLKDAPDHSIAGNTYLGVPATKTFEGKPWDIMRKNGIVYDYVNNIAKPIASVTNIIKTKQANFYLLADGLILPGSIMADGKRVTDYSAGFLFDTVQFRYSEVIGV